MSYLTNDFDINYVKIKNINIKYYLSSLLSKFNFTHAFFTKGCSIFPIEELARNFHNDANNFINNQIHSDFIVHGSRLITGKRFDADGMVSESSNQNLWIYTADCMPIFFADKSSRLVAAIHCGRKGLEKNIIKKMLNQMQNLGSLKKNILVAIGPAISKENYFIDENCLNLFYKNNFPKVNSKSILDSKYIYKHSENKYSLDIRGYAFNQLISNSISPENIDISNSCTYKLDDQFYSWRREKIKKRNWNFITSKLF